MLLAQESYRGMQHITLASGIGPESFWSIVMDLGTKEQERALLTIKAGIFTLEAKTLQLGSWLPWILLINCSPKLQTSLWQEALQEVWLHFYGLTTSLTRPKQKCIRSLIPGYSLMQPIHEPKHTFTGLSLSTLWTSQMPRFRPQIHSVIRTTRLKVGDACLPRTYTNTSRFHFSQSSHCTTLGVLQTSLAFRASTEVLWLAAARVIETILKFITYQQSLCWTK